MSEQTKPKKPFALEHEEAKRMLTNAVNEAHTVNGVPFVFIEDMLTNLLYMVRNKANIERALARQTYNKELAEYNKAETEEEKQG